MQHGESGGSWRDDLRFEIVREILARAIGRAAVAELDMPHIVICRDETTGAVSYSGPFSDALEALVFAEHESALDRSLNIGEPMRFSAAALYPTPDHGPDPTPSTDPA